MRIYYMLTIYFIVISMLSFTFGCDVKNEKNKSKISEAGKQEKGLATFRSKLNEEKNLNQKSLANPSPLDAEEENKRKLFEEMKRK